MATWHTIPISCRPGEAIAIRVPTAPHHANQSESRPYAMLEVHPFALNPGRLSTGKTDPACGHAVLSEIVVDDMNENTRPTPRLRFEPMKDARRFAWTTDPPRAKARTGGAQATPSTVPLAGGDEKRSSGIEPSHSHWRRSRLRQDCISNMAIKPRDTMLVVQDHVTPSESRRSPNSLQRRREWPIFVA